MGAPRANEKIRSIVPPGFDGEHDETTFDALDISLVIPLAVFFAFQRYFVRGLLAGSVK